MKQILKEITNETLSLLTFAEDLVKEHYTLQYLLRELSYNNSITDSYATFFTLKNNFLNIDYLKDVLTLDKDFVDNYYNNEQFRNNLAIVYKSLLPMTKSIRLKQIKYLKTLNKIQKLENVSKLIGYEDLKNVKWNVVNAVHQLLVYERKLKEFTTKYFKLIPSELPEGYVFNISTIHSHCKRLLRDDFVSYSISTFLKDNYIFDIEVPESTSDFYNIFLPDVLENVPEVISERLEEGEVDV